MLSKLPRGKSIHWARHSRPDQDAIRAFQSAVRCGSAL